MDAITQYFSWESSSKKTNNAQMFKNTTQKIFSQIKSLDDFSVNLFCTPAKINNLISTVGKNHDDSIPDWFNHLKNEFIEQLFFKLSKSKKFKIAITSQHQGLTALHFATIHNLSPVIPFLKTHYFSDEESNTNIKIQHLLENIHEWKSVHRLKLSLRSQDTITFNEFVDILKTNGNIRTKTQCVLDNLTLNDKIPAKEKTLIKPYKI